MSNIINTHSSNIDWIVRASSSAFWTNMRRNSTNKILLEKEWKKDGKYSNYWHSRYCGHHNFMCMECTILMNSLIDLYLEDGEIYRKAQELIAQSIDHKCVIVPYIKTIRPRTMDYMTLTYSMDWAKCQLIDGYKIKMNDTIMHPILFIVYHGIKTHKKNATHNVFSNIELIMYINMYIEKDYNKFIQHTINLSYSF
jgi:hypothetical protein